MVTNSLFQACLTNTFQKKPDFVAAFNKEVEAKEEALKPRGPSGPKPGQKSLVVLAVIAALFALSFGGWKIYQVLSLYGNATQTFNLYRGFWEGLLPKNLQE